MFNDVSVLVIIVDERHRRGLEDDTPYKRCLQLARHPLRHSSRNQSRNQPFVDNHLDDTPRTMTEKDAFGNSQESDTRASVVDQNDISPSEQRTSDVSAQGTAPTESSDKPPPDNETQQPVIFDSDRDSVDADLSIQDPQTSIPTQTFTSEQRERIRRDLLEKQKAARTNTSSSDDLSVTTSSTSHPPVTSTAANTSTPPLTSKSTSVNSPSREQLLSAAISFLSSPNVRVAPRQTQVAFLRKKGLTEGEITTALKRSGLDGPASLVAL